ncbi:unnamed protein product [Rangifer tarandus platyrhynchus]|uniref:Uncharacterized protein n=1 Tax=Rangifer tarandus platyrhynchus TaxID=3082113 RepID=A0AC59Y2A3_RANTA
MLPGAVLGAPPGERWGGGMAALSDADCFLVASGFLVCGMSAEDLGKGEEKEINRMRRKDQLSPEVHTEIHVDVQVSMNFSQSLQTALADDLFLLGQFSPELSSLAPSCAGPSLR